MAWDPTVGRFLDMVDLVYHEAGHVIFRVFGNEFLTIAGGTIMQILVPSVCAAVFIKTRQYASGAITGVWVGQSFFHSVAYIKDARAMDLVLLGGVQGEGHDWNNMLFMLDMLHYDHLIGNIFHATGVIVMLGIVGWCSCKVIRENG